MTTAGTEFGNILCAFTFLCRGYIAPEILKDEEFAFLHSHDSFLRLLLFRFSFAADMYSLGIVAYQLASGGVYMCINLLMVI
jgi:serine/threonine protein kinase